MFMPLTFLWPPLLWLLWALPLQVLAYLWLLRRRRRQVLRYPNLQAVKLAAVAQPAWKRHLPPALFLLAMAALLLAAARPQTALPLPTAQATVMLAVDVSLSMRVDDVVPNRLEAARRAAKAFVRQLPADVRVGVVGFGGTAQLVQAPTRNREDQLAAIDRLQLQSGTAIGRGIVTALSALFPQDDAIDPERSRDDALGKRTAASAMALEPGSSTTAAIVLLTDGRSTTGIDPQEAASIAAARGVRIHTVGLGAKDPRLDELDGWSAILQLDEDVLRAVAGATRGDYFHASTGESLLHTYEQLGARLQMETRSTEASGLLALLAMALLVVAAGLSQLWRRRVV